MALPIRLVLDTNVVIDWLVFDHPFMAPLREQAASGSVAVLTHELAIQEFERVLAYPELQLADTFRADVLMRYRMQTTIAAMPSGFDRNAWQLPSHFPNCRDRDDDLFLALTYHAHATALVSRDKALLKMRKRMRKFGVTILDVQQLIALLREQGADDSK